MESITLRPTALQKRVDSSYWTNYNYAYDNNETTYANNVNSIVHFRVNLSSLPSNAVIKSGYLRIFYYRIGSTDSIPYGGFSYTNSSTNTPTQLSNNKATLTSYHTKEWTETAVFNFTEAEQSTWKSSTYPCIWMHGQSGRVYEIQYVLTYEVPVTSKIYVGGSQALEVYVGSTKATAVYIGSTRIL